jgi:hypothetical protein
MRTNAFATSANDRVTKDIWIYYALVFSVQISRCCLTLLAPLRDQDLLLIVDGHKTRISTIAAVIFLLNRIDIHTLLGHMSHLAQMLDVVCYPGVKTVFRNELEK